MIRFAKSFLSFIALACAAALLIVSFPKAAHAVAAALVQITNTADNPAVTQDVSKMASEIVNLGCTDIACVPVESTGGVQYVVPAGKSLVVTAVDIDSPSGPVTLYLLDSPPGSYFLGYKLATYSGISGQVHYAYPSGIVWGSGRSPILGVRTSCGSLCSEGITTYLYGYLTSN